MYQFEFWVPRRLHHDGLPYFTGRRSSSFMTMEGCFLFTNTKGKPPNKCWSILKPHVTKGRRQMRHEKTRDPISWNCGSIPIAFHFRGYIWFRHPYKKVALSLSLSGNIFIPTWFCKSIPTTTTGVYYHVPLAHHWKLTLVSESSRTKELCRHHFKSLHQQKQYQKIGNITINKSFFAESIWPNSSYISPTHPDFHEISGNFSPNLLPFGVPKTQTARFDLCICQLLSQRLTIKWHPRNLTLRKRNNDSLEDDRIFSS